MSRMIRADPKERSDEHKAHEAPAQEVRMWA